MRAYGTGAKALSCSISAIALLAASSATAQAQTVLDTITVIANKTEENVWDTLAPVSLVHREDIERMMPSTVAGAFFGVPGVSFPQRSDDLGTAINIRGLQDFGRVAVVIDGARQNFVRSGHQAGGQFFLDPDMIGGADVVRGPVANIYGSGAIGGVVSFRTKDVEDVLKAGQRWGVVTTGMIGSNEYQGMGSVFAAVKPNENIEAIVGGVYRDRDNYEAGGNKLANPDNPDAGSTVLNSGNEMGSGLAKLTVRPADGHNVKFSFTGSEGKFDNGTPNATNTATIYASTVTNYIANANWRYQRPDDKLFDFSGNVYWTETNLDQTRVAGSSNPNVPQVGSGQEFKVETTGFDLHNTSRFEFNEINNEFTIGGDLFKDEGKTTDTDTTRGTASLNTPSGERTVGGAFAQLKSSYKWLEVIAALRYDAYDLSGSTGDSSGESGSDGDRFSPKVTIGLTPVQWFTIYGTYAEGYRAPTVIETFVGGLHPPVGGPPFGFIPNPDLKPEVGKNKEVGVNLRFDNIWSTGDALRMKANLFRNDIDNYIDQVMLSGPSCPTGWAFCYQYQNAPKARIDGFELESRYDAGNWFLNASYTILDGTDESNGQPLYNIPANTFAGTIGFRFLNNKLTTAINLLSVAPKDADDVPEGSIGSASYNIVNLNLGYQFNDDMAFNATVENLFNEWYAPYGNYTTVGNATIPVPSPGLTFKGALTLRFGDTFYKN